MAIIKSIKSALGFSDGDDYDYLEPTHVAYVNPFSKDNNVPEHDKGEEKVTVDQKQEYAIDAEYADKAARLMNEHAQAVMELVQQQWKREKDELLKRVEQADKVVAEAKEKMQANDAQRRTAQTRANDLAKQIATLQSEREQSDVEKKSLANRIKAMEMRNDDAGKTAQDVEKLTRHIEALRKQLSDKDKQLAEKDKLMADAKQAAANPQEIDQLKAKLQERDALVVKLQDESKAMQEQLDQANEELQMAEEVQKQLEEVKEFKDKKNNEIATLKQQVNDMQRRTSEYDEMRKKLLVMEEENNNLKTEVENLNAQVDKSARTLEQRGIYAGNQIDRLKGELRTATATIEDLRDKYNSLSTTDSQRDDEINKLADELAEARAELKSTQIKLEKKQHELNAATDALNEKDRRIAALARQVPATQDTVQEEVRENKLFDSRSAAPKPATSSLLDDLDEVDWVEPENVPDNQPQDDGVMPPHPGDDPRQLSLF